MFAFLKRFFGRKSPSDDLVLQPQPIFFNPSAIDRAERNVERLKRLLRAVAAGDGTSSILEEIHRRTNGIGPKTSAEAEELLRKLEGEEA
jgi:hypothetical protein